MPAPAVWPAFRRADRNCDFSSEKSPQFFGRKIASAENPQACVVADDQILVAAYDQVKAAPLHLGQKPVAADLVFDPADAAPNDRTARDRLGRKDRPEPMVGVRSGILSRKSDHAAKAARSRLTEP
jgi:hypothetical protein